MKKFKKLIPALCMLLVSAVLLGSSTYAWFSMNNKVTVTGMQISTTVSSNLFIAGDEIGSTAVKGDNNFKSLYNSTTSTGVLLPVSSVNGVSFFYNTPDNAKADGSADNKNYTALDSNFANLKDSYNKSSDDTVKGYVDYVFQLKAVNTDATKTADIRLNALDLIYSGAVDESRAFRVAFFVQNITGKDGTEGNQISIIAVGDKKNIYTVENAANFEAGKAVDNTGTVGAVTYNDTGALITGITASSTTYYKVVVRMWLEGEDDTCNNATFLKLSESWKLNLELSLVASDDTNVASVGKIAKYCTIKNTASLGPKETVNGVDDLQAVTGVTKGGKQVYADKALNEQDVKLYVAGATTETNTEVTSYYKIVA